MIRNDITSSITSSNTHGGTAAIHQPGVAVQSTKRSQKGRIKSSTVVIYASVFVLLVAVIAVGYRAPEQALATTAVANVAEPNDQPAVNAVVATNIAASVAEAADLAVAPNVAELAVATRVQSEYEGSNGDSSTISKPTIVEVSAASSAITSYVVKEGDTVQSVAAAYGLSPETIKWANNLSKDTLAAGATLQILPRNGVTYVVREGDTLEKIASKYQADASLIATANDLEINGVSAGLKIVIPNGVLPETERPGYVAPRAASSNASSGTYIVGYSAGFGGDTWRIKVGTPMYSGNTYARGNCTAYAFDRRVELGIPVGARWGNASSWATSARNAGYTVNRTPSVGAVMQNGGGYGHVGVVEKILPNGDIQISEMNARVSGGGFNIVSGRTISASVAGQYLYIH